LVLPTSLEGARVGDWVAFTGSRTVGRDVQARRFGLRVSVAAVDSSGGVRFEWARWEHGARPRAGERVVPAGEPLLFTTLLQLLGQARVDSLVVGPAAEIPAGVQLPASGLVQGPHGRLVTQLEATLAADAPLLGLTKLHVATSGRTTDEPVVEDFTL